MPVLTAAEINACLSLDSETSPSVSRYEPTADDVRRVAERLEYAGALLRSAGVTTLVLPADSDTGGQIRDMVDAARRELASHAKASDRVVRLARILLIDCARLLRGASHVVSV